MKIRQPVKRNKRQAEIEKRANSRLNKQYKRDVQEARELERQGVRDAANAIRNMSSDKRQELIKKKFVDSLVHGLRQRLIATVAVDDRLRPHNPPIELEVGPTQTGSVDAYTDFRKISITVSDDKVPADNDRASQQEFFQAVKGVFHHEAGHILHTWPLWDMWKEAPQSFLDRASAEGITHHGQLHTTWNVVEDQRMESARVRDYPAVQGYFENMMGRFLLVERDEKWWSFSGWALIAGREYLPTSLRDLAESQFSADAAEWLRLVRAYKAATDAEGLLNALLDCHLFVREAGQQPENDMDQHDENGMAIDGEGKAQQSATTPGDGSDGQQKAAGGSSGEEEQEDGQGGAPGKGEGSGEEQGEDGDGTSGKGEGTGEVNDDPTELGASSTGAANKHLSSKSLQDVIDSLISKDLTADEKVLVDEALAESKNFGLPSYDGQTRTMTSQENGEGVTLQHGIVRALETYVTQATPTWVLDTEEGYIDPCAYRTKEIGEYNYHVGMQGEQQECLDLHVSVLADVSYSMSTHMAQLSTILYGMKLALDELNIPSNFSLWSSDNENYAIYRDGAEDVVYPAMGGTDPRAALDDAVLANEEQRPNHLFLVLTDGAWGTVNSVSKWKTSKEQQFVIVKFGQGPDKIHGADAIINIPSLSGFPDVLKDGLDRMLAAIV